MKCPKCNTEISNNNINIQTDIAQCPNCNYIFKISENLFEADDTFNINEPPPGAWITKDIDQTVIGATTRSPIAFFLVPFMVVWSGGALGGLYGSQILSGHFSPGLSLFGIPFIIGSVIFWSVALMAIWGKVEVTLDKEGGKIFTGIAKLGLTKQFKWNEVSSITEGKMGFRYPGSTAGQILLEGKNRIGFGSGLNEARTYYLLRSLQKIQRQLAKGGKL
jgi:hypothetical protein